jgi:hypothetical protein
MYFKKSHPPECGLVFYGLLKSTDLFRQTYEGKPIMRWKGGLLLVNQSEPNRLRTENDSLENNAKPIQATLNQASKLPFYTSGVNSDRK